MRPGHKYPGKHNPLPMLGMEETIDTIYLFHRCSETSNRTPHQIIRRDAARRSSLALRHVYVGSQVANLTASVFRHWSPPYSELARSGLYLRAGLPSVLPHSCSRPLAEEPTPSHHDQLETASRRGRSLAGNQCLFNALRRPPAHSQKAVAAKARAHLDRLTDLYATRVEHIARRGQRGRLVPISTPPAPVAAIFAEGAPPIIAAESPSVIAAEGAPSVIPAKAPITAIFAETAPPVVAPKAPIIVATVAPPTTPAFAIPNDHDGVVGLQ
jgi:hypothetical protein